MISVSIVSHGHGEMLPPLIGQLLNFPEVGCIILTQNLPEKLIIPKSDRLKVVNNLTPKGFGENHNVAFALCDTPFFCVLNPDITFLENLFPKLISQFADMSVGLVAPMVVNQQGIHENSVRHFISPLSIFLKNIFACDDSYHFAKTDASFYAEWVGGMFMLFKSSVYRDLGGFDQNYFLYVEDTDICTRLWLRGYRLLVVPGVQICHSARRATLKNWRHLYWHISSLSRYFYQFLFRLPKIG